jgi:hypothetical protein
LLFGGVLVARSSSDGAPARAYADAGRPS